MNCFAAAMHRDVAVGTTIADRPRTDPYKRVYAYGSFVLSCRLIGPDRSKRFEIVRQYRIVDIDRGLEAVQHTAAVILGGIAPEPPAVAAAA